MTIFYMKALNFRVLKGLDKLVFGLQRDVKGNWYEAHLTFLVLLGTLADAYQHQVEYRDRMSERVSDIPSIISQLCTNDDEHLGY